MGSVAGWCLVVNDGVARIPHGEEVQENTYGPYSEDRAQLLASQLNGHFAHKKIAKTAFARPLWKPTITELKTAYQA